jgi:pyruvate,water dikinase
MSGFFMTTSAVPDHRLTWLNRGPVTTNTVGGKGASLSRLCQLGAPVPDAFALTTHAYLEFATSLGIPLRASDVADSELADLRARIECARISADLRDLLAAEFASLRDGGNHSDAFAVRSSATAEDSAEFSFAGLHDTVLDVRDMDSLERAITKCWASLWSDRAVAYRRAGGLATDGSGIAVVVQRLIRSDVSFVVFTVDPVSHRDEHLVIAATWGLGEAVVSGLVVPDHIVVGPDNTVEEYVVGDKHQMIIPSDGEGGGVRELPVPRALRTCPALTHQQASEIGALARKISCRLGFPADLEGAIAGGEIYLLQARPITTLPL